MPATNTQAFGTGQGDEGVVISPDVQQLMQDPQRSGANDLHRIAERYCLPPTLPRQPFNLAAANAVQKCDFSQVTINGLVITVATGVAFVYLGDYSGFAGVAGPVPDFVVSAGVVPTTCQFALPPGQYIITVQANGAAATGVILGMAL